MLQEIVKGLNKLREQERIFSSKSMRYLGCYHEKTFIMYKKFTYIVINGFLALLERFLTNNNLTSK